MICQAPAARTGGFATAGNGPFIPSPRPPPGEPPPRMPPQQLGPAGPVPIPGMPLHQQAAMLGRSPPHGPAAPGMYGSPGGQLLQHMTVSVNPHGAAAGPKLAVRPAVKVRMQWTAVELCVSV